MNRSYILFRDLHKIAQQVEHYAFTMKVYKNTDKQKFQQAQESLDQHWKEMEKWKKYMEGELITNKPLGKIWWGG